MINNINNNIFELKKLEEIKENATSFKIIINKRNKN